MNMCNFERATWSNNWSKTESLILRNGNIKQRLILSNCNIKHLIVFKNINSLTWIYFQQTTAIKHFSLKLNNSLLLTTLIDTLVYVCICFLPQSKLNSC